jgi:hypothetical protein
MVGGAGGGAMALTNMSDAADTAEDTLINKYEQQLARSERMERLREARDRQQVAMERQEVAMRGPNLNQGLPRRGMGAGQAGPAAYT